MSINYTNDNTVIFTLARMNPPTPGHLFLIQTLIYEAVSKNIDKVYIILSKTNNNNKDPIPCEEKQNVLGHPDDITKTMINILKDKLESETDDETLKGKIANLNVITVCVQTDGTPFTPLAKILIDLQDANLILCIGEDRKNMLDSITNYFFKWENVNSITGIILPREEMNEYIEKSKIPEELDKLEISKVPINAMSATFVRNIVENHRRDKFIELYSPYLDEEKIPGLYEKILHGVEYLDSIEKSEEQEKPLKYQYPMIKGISIFPIKETEKPKKERKTTKTTKNRENRENIQMEGGKKTKRNCIKKIKTKKYVKTNHNQRRNTKKRSTTNRRCLKYKKNKKNITKL
jgi:nicotinic acid mononucleotide adenylyltransferase